METVTQPDELLPCPFCGYTAKRRNVEFQRGTEDREGTPIAVFCPDCAATGPFRYCPAENADMALTAWNTRAAPRIGDQVDVEALKRDFEGFLRHRAIDNSKTKDAWDREIYAHSHVQAMWEGFLYGRTAHYNLTRKGD